MERLLLLLKESGGIGAPADAPDAYAVVPDAALPKVVPAGCLACRRIWRCRCTPAGGWAA
jgi:hypothetical protein